MKKLLLTLSVVACAGWVSAQSSAHFFCGNDSMNRQRLEENPWLKEVNKQLEEHAATYVQQKQNQRSGSRSGQIYTIPIVFHILHDYGTENISDAQIYDAVRILNEDFRKRNADTTAIVPTFKPIAADCEIEFKLPTRDPKGKPTNGINRYRSMATYYGDDNAKFETWPRDMYMNVWITRDLNMPAGVLGYAYFPGSVEGIGGLIDGIVIKQECIGTIGTGNPAFSRALTHEIGHYLNLMHIWGNGEVATACGDDGVNDTPITRGWQSQCRLTNNDICEPGKEENVQNYMDYSFCYRMFTEGQRDRMHATLNSNVSGRSNLWSEYTQNYTGANISDNTNTAPPVADFYFANKSACVGEPVAIKDFSWRGPITSWEWQFDNASPAVSNDQNPTITFNQSGWQKVSLKVTNAFGNDTKTEEQFIYVRSGNSQPFYEGFEDFDFVRNNYITENYDGNASQWAVTNRASYGGGGSFMLNNYDSDRYDIDAFTTPVFDLSGSSNLTFQYSLATRASYPEDINDRLRIFYSVNCGATWSIMLNQTGLPLITAGNFSSFFVPNKENQWREVSIPLPNAALNAGEAMFKFEYTRAEFANNLYIDNINIEEDYTTVAEVTDNISLNVFPNPSKGNFYLTFNSDKVEKGLVRVFDMTGKMVFEETYTINTGENKIAINAKFSTGLYQVNVLAGKQSANKKVQIINQ